jgi:hypothetical protein
LSTSAFGRVAAGDQEPDHESGVQDRAESERLGYIKRYSPRRGGRDLPLKQRVEPLVGRPLEGEAQFTRGEYGLESLHGREVAPGVVANSDTKWPERSRAAVFVAQ